MSRLRPRRAEQEYPTQLPVPLDQEIGIVVQGTVFWVVATKEEIAGLWDKPQKFRLATEYGGIRYRHNYIDIHPAHIGAILTRE